jgi:3-oxoacyl-[acyl-carrier protein] reductase
MANRIDLGGKRAVVTGGAQGIGRAIALRLASAGANVAVADVNLAQAEETAREIGAKGPGRGIAVQCDVTNPADAAALVQKTLEAFPSLDILVNNAGVTRDGLLMRMSDSDWDLVLNVNLKSAFLLTKAVARTMMKQSYGRIVNVSSIIGVIGNAGQANYAASKGGLIALTKSVALEFASRNITCNAVAPGFIETAMTAKLPEEVRDKYRQTIPLARFGAPEDVAAAVLFLVSEDAAYITGQVLHIDGGLARCRRGPGGIAKIRQTVYSVN